MRRPLRVHSVVVAMVSVVGGAAVAHGASAQLASPQATSPQAASGRSATVRTQVDTTLITLGDPVRMSVRIEHAIGARVVWPDSIDVSPFEVLSAEAGEPAAQGGRAVTTAELTLTAFELGTLDIPPIPIEVVGPDGTERVTTDRFVIDIQSVGADEGGDIRGIRGPLALPGGVREIGLGLLLVLAALLVAFGVYRYWKTRRDVAAGIATVRLPHEIALEALGELASSDHLVRGEVKEYHIELSDILRHYIERRFAVPALEMTTRQVTRGLERQGAPAEFRARLASFLQRADMVKFAKVRPGHEASRELLEEGRALVVMTVPRPVLARDTSGTAPEENEVGDEDRGAVENQNHRADEDEVEVPVAVDHEEGGAP